MGEVVVSRNIVTQRLLLLDKLDAEILECGAKVDETRGELNEELKTAAAAINETSAEGFRRCDERVTAATAQLDDKLSRVDEQLTGAIGAGVAEVVRGTEEARGSVCDRIEKSEERLSEAISSGNEECTRLISAAKDSVEGRIETAKDQLIGDVDAKTEKIERSLDASVAKLEEKMEATGAVVCLATEQGFSACEQRISEARGEVEAKVEETCRTMSEVVISKSEDCLSKSAEHHAVVCETLRDAAASADRNLQLAIGDTHERIESSTRAVSAEVARSGEELTRKLSEERGRLEEKMRESKAELERGITEAVSSLAEKSHDAEEIASVMREFREKMEETEAYLRENTERLNGYILAQDVMLENLRTKLEECDKKVDKTLDNVQDQNYRMSLLERQQQEGLDKLRATVAAPLEGQISDAINRSSLTQELVEGVRKIEHGVALCGRNLDRVEKNFQEELDEVKDFIKHLTKSVKCILEEQEERASTSSKR